MAQIKLSELWVIVWPGGEIIYNNEVFTSEAAADSVAKRLPKLSDGGPMGAARLDRVIEEKLKAARAEGYSSGAREANYPNGC